jgi:hypothetical protein
MWINRSSVYPEPGPFHSQSDLDLALSSGHDVYKPETPDLFRQLAKDILAILVEEQGKLDAPTDSAPAQVTVDEAASGIEALCSRIQASTKASAAPSNIQGASRVFVADILHALQSYASAVSPAPSHLPGR